jgi:CBS domain-containing protein
MSNIVNQKIIEFLIEFLPFSFLKISDIELISNEISIKIYNKNEIIFKTNDQLNKNFFVINSGSIGLYAISNTSELLVDQCYPGTIFGLRPHFAQNVYQLTSKALQDTIIYSIPFEYFYEIISKNQEAIKYLLKCFASNKRNPENKLAPGFLVSQNVLNSIHNNTFDYFQQLKYNKNICVTSPDSTVDDVIKLMNANTQSCVVIEENNQPIGIITDVNLRNNFEKIKKNSSILASDIMSFPVITASEHISLPEAQLFFVQNSIQYICITKNGTINSKPIGLISINDVIAAAVDNPSLIIQQIKTAININELKEIRNKINQFIDNTSNLKIPIQHTSKIIGEFNDELIKKVISLILSKQEVPPPTLFTWFSMGSIARHEQILLTDQNSGLIFFYEKDQDRNYTEIRNYFIEFADKVVNALHSIGYEYCEENIMSNKLKCCKSLIEWNKMYQNWVLNTKEFKDEINPLFFDTHFVFGDENLYNNLFIFKNVDFSKEELFLSYLGKEALKYPAPLGFFKQFLLESDKENKDEFNIKTRAIQPLTDAARILLLRKNIVEITNTIERYSKLIQLDPKNKLIYEDCIESFSTLQEFRTEEGLKDNNNGNLINIEELSNQDQNKLKQSFTPLQSIQELIKDKFNFNIF